MSEERMAVGKAPVGFVNPVLYKNPQVLNDITNGSNPGCDTNGFLCRARLGSGDWFGIAELS